MEGSMAAFRGRYKGKPLKTCEVIYGSADIQNRHPGNTTYT
jgi:hypothetical protein